ncbi:MAG: hypothetical protein SFU98_11155 [Leptospiraceae bacterium]|nr:hypothetical protein [Leptospiraceae bacterium]
MYENKYSIEDSILNWDNLFALIFFGLPILLVLYGMFDWISDLRFLFSLSKRISHEKDLRETGVKATAIVKSILQTGTFVNENPEVDLVLDSSYSGSEINIRTIVTLVMIPRLQPECQIEILVNPENPSEAVLDTN